MNPSTLAIFDNARVLTGPTGAGKSALALDYARENGAEIISMDSMALYRGMDIGTAKPNSRDRAAVPHHLIDVLDVWESSTVAWWLAEAAKCVQDITSRGKEVLFVGGTPLYLKAMLFGLFDAPPADATVRQKWQAKADANGPESLHAHLAEVDPQSAARLHPNDTRRVVRALEVWELTGQPLSAWQQQWRGREPQNRLRCVWIDWPRKDLHRRINERVAKMFETGLVAEVEILSAAPRPMSREARQALGYKEVLEHLAGDITLEEAILRVQTGTRQFAKRQITWFRHLPFCNSLCGELTSVQFKAKMDEL